MIGLAWKQFSSCPSLWQICYSLVPQNKALKDSLAWLSRASKNTFQVTMQGIFYTLEKNRSLFSLSNIKWLIQVFILGRLVKIVVVSLLTLQIHLRSLIYAVGCVVATGHMGSHC